MPVILASRCESQDIRANIMRKCRSRPTFCGSMPNPVNSILALRAPSKIRDVIVGSISVEMAGFLSFWTRTGKRIEHKAVHVEFRAIRSE
jgi:hypothetical protein